MALVNPNIAMSFKPTTEYQPRNVLAEYAQLQQIQGGQRQAEMADMQMQEYRQNKEALGRIQAAIVAKGGPPDLKAAANEMIKNPQYMDKGIQILETLKNQEAMDAYFNPPAAQPSNALAPPISGALGSGTFDPMAPAAPVNAMAPVAAPAAPVNQLGADRSSIETKIAQLGQINDPRALAEVKRLERQLTAMEPTPDIKTMTALGYPATREGFEAYRAAQRQEQLTFEQRKELARVGKSTTVNAPAPTITQIQDPSNPSQMITIDARQYQGGGMGSLGVIGTTGQAPKVAVAAAKKEEGSLRTQDILDTIRTAYDTLDQERALPSEQRNVMSNALSYIASTGAGQVVGRMGGTKEQTQRDIISSARNQLLMAVKDATGMSAQNLNSNVEFKSWLDSLTDPTRSIESNRSVLDNLEKFIASGGKSTTKKPPVAAPAAKGGGIDTSNPLLR